MHARAERQCSQTRRNYCIPNYAAFLYTLLLLFAELVCCVLQCAHSYIVKGKEGGQH